MKDPQFVASAKKSKLNVSHVTWQQIEKSVEEIYSLSPKMREDLQVIAGLKKKKR